MEIGKRAPQLRRGTPPAPARIAGNAPEIFGNLNRKPARRALRVLFSDPTKRGFPRAPRQKKRAVQAEIRGSKAPAPPVKIPRTARIPPEKFHAAAFRRGSSRRNTPRGIFQKRRARRGPESRPRGLQPHSARLRHPAPLRRSGPGNVPRRRYLPEFLFEITSNTESGRE